MNCHSPNGREKSECCSVVSDSLRLHGLWPVQLLCPWNSPGKNIGVDSHSLLQGIFPTHELNPGLLHCRQILYCLSHKRELKVLWLWGHPSLSRSPVTRMQDAPWEPESVGHRQPIHLTVNFSECPLPPNNLGIQEIRTNPKGNSSNQKLDFLREDSHPTSARFHKMKDATLSSHRLKNTEWAQREELVKGKQTSPFSSVAHRCPEPWWLIARSRQRWYSERECSSM